MDTLFSYSMHNSKRTPLAERMRPRSLEEFVGQEHLLGPKGLLRALIENDRLSSIILWGPPGTGKTTIARIVAHMTKAYFSEFSAVTSGVADIRNVVKEATDRRDFEGRQTILFVDEIHRFNKAQQDAFLPHIEAGTIVLIGATTENPGFEVNAPILSRSRLFRLEQLSDDGIIAILKRALADAQRGLGNLGLEVEDNAIEHIAKNSNGDARVALTALELAANSLVGDSAESDVVPTPASRETAGKNETGEESAISGQRPMVITVAMAEEAINKKQLPYDRAGDAHYDIISAFIKSLRGTDPDAAVYYLARMLESGEDAKFIARRMVIFASEDIGNADPQALVLATATVDALTFIGMPEAKFALTQCATYLASAPKSNSAKTAIFGATADLRDKRVEPIPNHLRNAPTALAKKLGHGKGYKYPHDFEENYIEETYLPDNLKDKVYYQPSDNGHERTIKERLNKLRKKQV
ncbi:MAG: replication-associated recombination protein A [Candidatus Aquicultor sp.]|nr:replication-associated recombination protein A [Candidatus Aquicultor sp.]